MSDFYELDASIRKDMQKISNALFVLQQKHLSNECLKDLGRCSDKLAVLEAEFTELAIGDP